MSTRFITAIVSVASIGLIAVAEETEITATAGDARIRTRVDVQTNEVEEAVVERLEGGTWTVKETATDAVEDVIEDVEDPMPPSTSSTATRTGSTTRSSWRKAPSIRTATARSTSASSPTATSTSTW